MANSCDSASMQNVQDPFEVARSPLRVQEGMSTVVLSFSPRREPFEAPHSFARHAHDLRAIPMEADYPRTPSRLGANRQEAGEERDSTLSRRSGQMRGSPCPLAWRDQDRIGEG